MHNYMMLSQMSQRLTAPGARFGCGRYFRSVHFSTHDERNVLATEAERIRHSRYDASVSRLVWHDVERDCGIRDVVVDRRRYALVLKRQEGENCFDNARSRESVADHRFVGRHRNCACVISKYRYSILSFSGVLVPCALM